MLRRAISCFLKQTYQPRELLVLFEADDFATREYLATLNEPSVFGVEVPVSPKLSLGSLRNLSVKVSRGHFLAQWDDDDWHGPTRLADQIGAVLAGRKAACVLSRWILYDQVAHAAYLSGIRLWEGSLVAERSAMSLYLDSWRGEDTCVIDRIFSEGILVTLEQPQLYVYIYHGANTWDRSHWQQNILQFAQPLGREDTEWVRAVLQL